MGNSQGATALGTESANHRRWDRAGGLPGMKARHMARSAGGACPLCERCRPKPTCECSCPPTDVARDCAPTTPPGVPPGAQKLGPNPCKTDLTQLKKKGKHLKKMNRRRVKNGKAPIVPCESYGVAQGGEYGEKCASLFGHRPRTLKRMAKTGTLAKFGAKSATAGIASVAGAGALAGAAGTAGAGVGVAGGAGLALTNAGILAAGSTQFVGATAGITAGGLATGAATAATGGLLAGAALGGAYHLATKNIYQDIYRCKAKGS